MAESSSLRDAWLHAPDGRLCAREQAKAWALREIWNEEGKSSYGLLPWVAQRLKTNVGGSPTGDPPSPPAIAQFFSKLDDDPDWYPGKRCGEKPGPKRVLRGSKKTAIVAADRSLRILKICRWGWRCHEPLEAPGAAARTGEEMPWREIQDDGLRLSLYTGWSRCGRDLRSDGQELGHAGHESLATRPEECPRVAFNGTSMANGRHSGHVTSSRHTPGPDAWLGGGRSR